MKAITSFITGIAFLLSTCGCTPLVKTDLEGLMAHPEDYDGKEVVVVTDLARLVEDPDAYWGRKVELTGYADYKGFWASNYWHFILKDAAGNAITCFERNYRVEAWLRPVVAVKRAEREGRVVTVVGKVERGPKIELDWIEHEGLHIDTDLKPKTMPAFH